MCKMEIHVLTVCVGECAKEWMGVDHQEEGESGIKSPPSEWELL